jgi:hypothetical protein
MVWMTVDMTIQKRRKCRAVHVSYIRASEPDSSSQIWQRTAATPVAPAPDGADAHASDESVTSGGAQRRPALQEEVVGESRTRATGGVSVSPVGKPATARSAGVAGSAEPDHHGAEPSDRAGSREVSRGAALADASRGRFSDRAGFRVNRREGGAVPVRQADCELSGTGAVRGVERRSATAGAHHETGQLASAFPAGGGSPSHGAQRPGVAREVFPPGDAAGTEDRQGGHGS